MALHISFCVLFSDFVSVGYSIVTARVSTKSLRCSKTAQRCHTKVRINCGSCSGKAEAHRQKNFAMHFVGSALWEETLKKRVRRCKHGHRIENASSKKHKKLVEAAGLSVVYQKVSYESA